MEETRRVIGEYFAALRAMDPDAWANTFAEDAVSHDPVGAPPHEGREALRQFLAGIASMFETFGLKEDHVFVTGKDAAVKWSGWGKGKNGKSVKFEGIDVIHVNDKGKIQRIEAYWDPTPMLAEVMG